MTGALQALDRRSDRAVGRTPTEHEHATRLRAEDFDLRDVLRDAIHFRLAHAHHEVVIVGIVRDVARDVLLLYAADAVFEAGRAGQRPRPRERALVARVGHEVRRI